MNILSVVFVARVFDRIPVYSKKPITEFIFRYKESKRIYFLFWGPQHLRTFFFIFFTLIWRISRARLFPRRFRASTHSASFSEARVTTRSTAAPGDLRGGERAAHNPIGSLYQQRLCLYYRRMECPDPRPVRMTVRARAETGWHLEPRSVSLGHGKRYARVSRAGEVTTRPRNTTSFFLLLI